MESSNIKINKGKTIFISVGYSQQNNQHLDQIAVCFSSLWQYPGVGGASRIADAGIGTGLNTVSIVSFS
jgi:hypothetical protein